MHLNAPDTYIQEQTRLWAPELSNSDTTAAFIGYTEKGPLMKPVTVHSLREYEKLFGRAEVTRVDVVIDTLAGDAAGYSISSPFGLTYYMYHCIQLYFANGGGACRVVSVGSHTDAINIDQLLAGLDALETEDVDLLLPADAAQLPAGQYYRFCQAMLTQCNKAGDRFAIIDLQDMDNISDFRNGVGNNYLNYAAVYSPYLASTLRYRYEDNFVNISIDGASAVTLDSLTVDAYIRGVRGLLDKQAVTLPPSGAVAGVYARADHERGVWRSVSDIRLEAVSRPKIKYSNLDQAPMNVDVDTGKSINAIRAFRDKGIVLWGARTLDGNNDKWRYIATRRLFIKIERDLRQITAAAVGTANMSRTRAMLKTVVASYLDELWRDGALTGTKASEAYFVQVSAGTDTTVEDLNINVGVAVHRPAEFITVTFTA